MPESGRNTARLFVNSLTVSRAVASLGVALTLGSPISYGLAGYAVASDFFDGKFARGLHVDSFQGGTFDNLADLAMFNAVEALALYNIDKLIQFPGIYDKIFTGLMAATLITTFAVHSIPWIIDTIHVIKKHNLEEEAVKNMDPELWQKAQQISVSPVFGPKDLNV